MLLKILPKYLWLSVHSRGTNLMVLTITIVLHKAKKEVIQCPDKNIKQTAFKETGSNIVYIFNNLDLSKSY